MLKLLESGKDVVTANKALLAEHGPELFDRARELGRSIAFEASVAGGIPIIANISQCLSANQIESLTGILNGTSNFILTQMEEQGADYAEALAEAQQLGLRRGRPDDGCRRQRRGAEAGDPGAPGVRRRVHWSDIPRRGIDKLEVADMRYARELGYRIKLLAVGAAGRRRAGTARLADARESRARRWPKCAARSTRSASWATPSGRSSFTGSAPGRCRPPRPSSPT